MEGQTIHDALITLGVGEVTISIMVIAIGIFFAYKKYKDSERQVRAETTMIDSLEKTINTLQGQLTATNISLQQQIQMSDNYWKSLQELRDKMTEVIEQNQLLSLENQKLKSDIDSLTVQVNRNTP